jgi:uncharacterized protein (DUF433 family)
MALAIDIGSLIVRTPEIRGGRPRIAGTGVTVRRVKVKDAADYLIHVKALIQWSFAQP